MWSKEVADCIASIEDEGAKPQILINTTIDRVVLPTEYFSTPTLVLNVGYAATKHGLFINEDGISFVARMRGKETSLFVPKEALIGVLKVVGDKPVNIFKFDGQAPSKQQEILMSNQKHTPHVMPEEKQTAKFKVIAGLGQGDGIPRAKLEVVR